MQTTDGRARFEAVQPESLVSIVRARIQLAILSGAFQPGERLRDSVIAAEMKVSRAPVRESLRSLHESGLVDKLPNRSFRVRVYDERDWLDLASMRIAAEALAVRLAVVHRSSSIGLATALERMSAADTASDSVIMIAADWEFHNALVQASKNRILTEAYGRLRDQVQLAINSNVQSGRGIMEGIVDRHIDLLERFDRAVAEGEPQLLIPTLENHICVGMGVPPLP